MSLKESIETLINDVRHYDVRHGTSRFEWKLRQLEKVIKAEPGLERASAQPTPSAKVVEFRLHPANNQQQDQNPNARAV